IYASARPAIQIHGDGPVISLVECGSPFVARMPCHRAQTFGEVTGACAWAPMAAAVLGFALLLSVGFQDGIAAIGGEVYRVAGIFAAGEGDANGAVGEIGNRSVVGGGGILGSGSGGWSGSL